jgi:hypothetical protein
MDGCILVANSDAGDAIARQGAARIAAECAHTSGGTEGLSGLHASFDCPAPVHNRPPVPDPFAGLAPPASSVCKSMPSGGNGNKSVTELTPGTYCGQRFSGNFDLAPGEYILRGGEIKLGGNGGISGNGVTLFLLEDASITFGANETINLTAPTEGDYAGIVIFQAPGNTADLKMNGTADSRITGFIYAPDAHVDLTGNVSVSDEGHCTRIVAGTIRFIGNSSIRTDCEEELADREIEIEDYVRLTR